MPVADAFALMPFTTTFALMLTFSIVVLFAMAFPVRASAEAAMSGEPWSLSAQLFTRLFGAFAVTLGAIGFVGMIVAALFESM